MGPARGVHGEPEHAAEAEGEPAGEEGAGDGEHVVEDGDNLGDQPRGEPRDAGQADPDAARLPCPLVHEPVLAVPEQPHVDVLDADVAVDHARDDDGGDRDAPCDFGDDRGGAVQCRARDLVARVVVDDDRGDQVHGDVAGLEEGQRLGEVVRVLQLGDEGEEGRVSRVREDHVGDGEESRDKGQAGGGPETEDDAMAFRRGLVHGRLRDGHRDHRHHDRPDDADEAGDRVVAEMLQCPGKGTQQAHDHADHHPSDGTCGSSGESVHADGKREDVTAHDEDVKQVLSQAKC